MSIPRLSLLAIGLGFTVLCGSSCVMQRTVKEGDEVVAQGYVVKSPLIAP